MKNDPRSCERSLHNVRNCVRSLKKKNRTSTGFEPATRRIPARCSNQLSYEATDVGSWSVMCSYVAVKEMNVIDVYEINHIRNV